MRQQLTLNPSGDKLYFTFPYSTQGVERVKTIPGRVFNRDLKLWELPLSLSTIEEVTAKFPGTNIHEELFPMIQKEKEQRKAITQMKADGWSKAKPLYPMPLKQGITPFNHQILAFNIGINLNSVALLMEQGCGKSLTAIAIAGHWFSNKLIKRVLIFAPASVISVWPREFNDYAGFPNYVLPLIGPVSARVGQIENIELLLRANPQLQSKMIVAVTNYEASWRMEDALIKFKPDLVICDESQRIKGYSSEQTKAVTRIGKTAKKRMILTGTPVSQGPIDFFAQYRFLDPSIFGYTVGGFKNRYCIMGGFSGKQIVAYTNQDELIRKAHSIAFRCTKAECLDLPEQIDQVLYCELEPSAKKIYNQLKAECVAECGDGKAITAANVIVKMLRLSQLTGGFVGVDNLETGELNVTQVSSAKLKLLSETLDDLMDAGKKVVIGTRFRAEINEIGNMLQKKGIVYTMIDGSVPNSERGKRVEWFQKDPKVKVFLANIQCAGLGITLTAADTEIIYSESYSFSEYDQFRCRIHRIGQKNNCTYIHLLAQGTIDEKIHSVLKRKGNVAKEVVDNWREYLS